MVGALLQNTCVARTRSQTAEKCPDCLQTVAAPGAAPDLHSNGGAAPGALTEQPSKPRLEENWSPQASLAVASNVKILAPYLEHVRVASPNDFIPSSGPFNLLVFKPFADKDNTSKEGPPVERLTYRAWISGGESSDDLSIPISPSDVWPEAATRGTDASPGTDFKRNELPEGKTLLRLDANMDLGLAWRRHARLYVIGAAGADGRDARVIGSFETIIVNKRWAALLAIVACLIAYILAAVATYRAHQTQRVYDDAGKLIGARPAGHGSGGTPGWADRLKASMVNPSAKIDHGHGPLVGTNYMTVWAHLFNPVVLSAGGNGLGNATNLQVLFVSVIVFGVVLYSWLMTGHLSGLSSTVLLLMGISGVGATAAAGAEVTKNRVSFDNWAWLIIRGWLPPGGIAEVNAAKWKDIFTTNGAFDVYRFQMICFSVVVGISLISVGAQVNDLSSFEIPQSLLGILGLSQVVYVAGKLVAPPSISDLDEQIGKLIESERKLRELNEAARSTLAGTNVVTWTVDGVLSQAQKEYADYLEIWERTKTMFQTTLGRLVPDTAASQRPPFAISDIILNKLPDGAAGRDYKETLFLAGMPGAGPYAWSIVSGKVPLNTRIVSAQNGIDGVLTFPGKDAIADDYRFTLRVIAPEPSQTITKDFLLRIVK
ncbi:MAG TPA: hypothetical protein DCW29_15645 [Janthinobacterium sp.]|nr:hypothetical protein [Janthinobacterium sp.]